MHKRRYRIVPAMVILVGLGGCTLMPEYTRPEAPISTEWPAGAAYQEAALDAPLPSDLPWKEFFTDPRLQQLIEMALENNRDLRIAALNVERMRALYGIQRAEIYPTVDAIGAAGKRRLAEDLSGTGHPETVKQYTADLGVLSWEIDFFGRIRSLEQQALETYLSSEHARRSAQVLLISEVANAYLSLAANRESLQVTQSTLESQLATYDLVRRRCEKGLSPELDLYQAQTRVEAARVDAALFERLVAQDENALCLLIGSSVSDDLLPESLGTVDPSMEISPGLTSEAILGRPDILQAEHQLRAANANIGAARAAFFPRISLTTTVGTASDELSGLFKSGSNTWSFVPQAVMPIFDARLGPALETTKVDREMVQTQYEKAIQRAFREVADALAVQGTVKNQLTAQQSLVGAVSETYRLANVRYLKGVDNFLTVIDAQRSLYVAQLRLISLRLTQFSNQVVLYAALGGGAGNPNEGKETE
jgi:outer membrane protein, multidrug efflux system